jgi:hypothetical protein
MFFDFEKFALTKPVKMGCPGGRFKTVHPKFPIWQAEGDRAGTRIKRKTKAGEQKPTE